MWSVHRPQSAGEGSISRLPFDAAVASISRLGLGCSRVGSFNNPVPIAEIRATLDRALDLGVTVFDTSNVYGQGDSEREIGRALAGRRAEAFVISKFGKRFSAAMQVAGPFKPLIKPLLQAHGRSAVTGQRGRAMRADFDPRRFAGYLDASLRRLRFDHLDGVLLHSPPAAVVNDPGVAESLAALVRSGRTRFFGVSCDDWACLEATCDMPGMGILQLPLGLIDQAVERGLDRLWAERGVRVFAREVLRDQPALTPADAVAAAAARPSVACVVVGASRRAHLEALAQALL